MRPAPLPPAPPVLFPQKSASFAVKKLSSGSLRALNSPGGNPRSRTARFFHRHYA
ncbi:hypothetical protein HMPREF3039_02176 [Akkermansia sp. KLE1798]|nr:hypothetical protein HMPREF3039_02176 [Akkermansia sp. KLE1798]